MTYLFGTAGRAALEAFVTPETLFAFDLDGTLAPIVSEPAGIIIRDEVRQSLIQLNGMAPIAIITGRSCADAQAHVGFTPRCLVGNHGAEGLPGEKTSGKNYARLCQKWIGQLHKLLPEMSEKGISLEDKEKSIALHYRHAPDQLNARKSILAAIDRLIPSPRKVSGKCVENIMPAGAPHKGKALESLMRHLTCHRAIFVGDDVTDEDVFSLNNPSVLGICVGFDQESSAGYYLHGQYEIIRLLHLMIALLDKRQPGQE